jgi:SAM-dependent methyltransferase
MPFEIPTHSPAPCYRYRDGIYAADFLAVAIAELDLFTEVARGTPTLPELCERLDICPRPADVLVTLLVAMDFLVRDDDRLRVTPIAQEHLRRESPWFLGPYYESHRHRATAVALLKTLRTDEPGTWIAEKLDWAKAMEDPEFATSFTAEMDVRGRILGPALERAFDWSGSSHLLDVGGGSGIYSCAVVDAQPHLRATVLEKSPVDRIAAQAVERLGYGHRVQTVGADMFRDPWPGDCDVHLFSNVLHDWSEAHVRDLLGRSFQSLRTGGFVIIHDAHINAEKTGPLPVAEYSVLLMHFTEGKCYAVSELEPWLEDAGFVDTRFAPTAAERSLVVARKP